MPHTRMPAPYTIQLALNVRGDQGAQGRAQGCPNEALPGERQGIGNRKQDDDG